METSLQDRLKSARKEANLSQQEIASRVGLTQSAYAKLETGVAQSSTLLPQIAFHFGVRPYWLATGKGPKFEQEMLHVDEKELVNMWRSFSEESKRTILIQFRALKQSRD